MDTKSEKRLVALSQSFMISRATIQPYFDESRRCFLIGKKEYPAHQAVDPSRKETWWETQVGDGPGQTPVLVSSREGYPIQHGHVFNGAAGELLLQIALDSGHVVAKEEEAGGKPRAMFYLQDDLREAKQNNKKADLVLRALTALSKLPGLDDKYDLAWALQKPVRKMSQEMVDSALNSVAMDTPQLLLQVLEGRDFKVAAFIEKLYGYGILSKKGEQWWFGSELIGADKLSAIAFLKDNKNTLLRDQLLNKLNQISNGTAVTRPVPEDDVEQGFQLATESGSMKKKAKE